MKMHSKFGCLMLAALTFLAGCISSLNPVYKDGQIVVDDSALGVWVQPESKASWVVTKRDAKSYTLVYTDENGHEGRFVARLARIDGTLFLDLFPEETKGSVNGFFKMHVVPIHTIYLVRRTTPNLELAAIDFVWLQKHLTDNPGALTHATFGGQKLITAPTEELQAFVAAHKDAFTNAFTLERAAKATK